jgi:hypothetical protein
MKEVYVLSNKKHSNLLFSSSFLFLISSIISFIYNIYDYSFLLCCLFFTSVNYWRKPTLSLRRNIDICCVIVSCIYHNYTLFSNNINIISIIFFYIGISFYFLAIFFSKNKKILMSVISHMLLHFFTNISCIIYIIYFHA